MIVTAKRKDLPLTIPNDGWDRVNKQWKKAVKAFEDLTLK